MSSFIYCELNNCNSFYCDVSISIAGGEFKGRAKIDTGAFSSLIPLKSLAISDKKCKEIKKSLVVRDDIPKTSISGVEGVYCSSIIDTMSKRQKLKFKGIAFYLTVDNFVLSDYDLGSINSYISCDTTGDILIGMNILKYFDIHIGISKENNKVVFLGCLKNKISNEYLSELEKHFGYIPSERCIARIFRRDLF